MENKAEANAVNNVCLYIIITFKIYRLAQPPPSYDSVYIMGRPSWTLPHIMGTQIYQVTTSVHSCALPHIMENQIWSIEAS